MLSSSQTNPKLGGNRGRKKEKAIRAVPRSKPTTFLKDQLSFSHFLQLSERSRPQNEKLMTTPHPLSLSHSLIPALSPPSLTLTELFASNVSYLSECSNCTFQHAPVHPETRLFCNRKNEITWVFLDETHSDCVTWVEELGPCEKWRAAAVHISSESLRRARLRLRLPQ